MKKPSDGGFVSDTEHTPERTSSKHETRILK